jgi:hypothetical protein
MRAFWEQVRIFLKEKCGQDPGKRDRHRLELRQTLAEKLELDHKTLKSFLNGHQIGLGAHALNRLLELYPALRAMLDVTETASNQTQDIAPLPKQLNLPWRD